MECLLGLLKLKVVRGLNLAICDPLSHSSDPYVVIHLGQQVRISFLRHTLSSDNDGWSGEFRCVNPLASRAILMIVQEEQIILCIWFLHINLVSSVSPDSTVYSDIT
jgi:hypothetical protein